MMGAEDNAELGKLNADYGIDAERGARLVQAEKKKWLAGTMVGLIQVRDMYMWRVSDGCWMMMSERWEMVMVFDVTVVGLFQVKRWMVFGPSVVVGVGVLKGLIPQVIRMSD